jgi:hypothetical protein
MRICCLKDTAGSYRGARWQYGQTQICVPGAVQELLFVGSRISDGVPVVTAGSP